MRAMCHNKMHDENRKSFEVTRTRRANWNAAYAGRNMILPRNNSAGGQNRGRCYRGGSRRSKTMIKGINSNGKINKTRAPLLSLSLIGREKRERASRIRCPSYQTRPTWICKNHFARSPRWIPRRVAKIQVIYQKKCVAIFPTINNWNILSDSFPTRSREKSLFPRVCV